MLYHLFRWLNEQHGFPYFVRYPSFRIAAAFVTSLAFCILFGPAFIRWLRRRNVGENLTKLGQERREIVPDGKAGTPTMGGLLTGAALLMGAVLWCRLDQPLVICGLAVFVVAAAIGLWDDSVKLFHPTRPGISFATKMIAFTALGFGVGLALQLWLWRDGPESGLRVLVLPFLKDVFLDLRVWFGIPFLLLVFLAICGSANAVNLTDGMDGLAAGCLAIAGIAMTAMNYIVGDETFASRFFVLYVDGGQEVAVLLAALVGASLGFLWFNAAPAQLFMGDVGSLPFGALLGYSAVASRMELGLLLVGGVFVIEAASVLIQVASYKLRHKRVFLCTPIHHHFQKQNVPETKIVVRFWCVAIVLAVSSIALFKVR